MTNESTPSRPRVTLEALIRRLRSVEGSLSWCEHRHPQRGDKEFHLSVLHEDIATVREAADVLAGLVELADDIKHLPASLRFGDERVEELAGLLDRAARLIRSGRT